MLKMNKLQKSALESAEHRCHKMGPWQNLDDHRTESCCTVCGAGVVCNTRPLPNEISIGGEAVALCCR